MIRVIHHITERQLVRIAEYCAANGLSRAEVIRRAIDGLLDRASRLAVRNVKVTEVYRNPDSCASCLNFGEGTCFLTGRETESGNLCDRYRRK